MTLYMPSMTKNAIKNAIYFCEGKYGLRYAFHALDNEDAYWLVRIRVSDETHTMTVDDLAVPDSAMTRDGVMAMLDVISQDFWKAKNKL